MHRLLIVLVVTNVCCLENTLKLFDDKSDVQSSTPAIISDVVAAENFDDGYSLMRICG